MKSAQMGLTRGARKEARGGKSWSLGEWTPQMTSLNCLNVQRGQLVPSTVPLIELPTIKFFF